MDFLNPISLLQFVLLCTFMYGFYKAAEMEASTPWMWAGASVAVYCYTWLHRGDGIITCVVGQIIVAIGK